jgi:hypothetical protein
MQLSVLCNHKQLQQLQLAYEIILATHLNEILETILRFFETFDNIRCCWENERFARESRLEALSRCIVSQHASKFSVISKQTTDRSAYIGSLFKFHLFRNSNSSISRIWIRNWVQEVSADFQMLSLPPPINKSMQSCVNDVEHALRPIGVSSGFFSRIWPNWSGTGFGSEKRLRFVSPFAFDYWSRLRVNSFVWNSSELSRQIRKFTFAYTRIEINRMQDWTRFNQLLVFSNARREFLVTYFGYRSRASNRASFMFHRESEEPLGGH